MFLWNSLCEAAVIPVVYIKIPGKFAEIMQETPLFWQGLVVLAQLVVFSVGIGCVCCHWCLASSAFLTKRQNPT